MEKLISAFIRFPGIGPRQARRFVYHLLGQNPATVETLAKDLLALKQQIGQCGDCYRFFVKNDQLNVSRCDLCLDDNRDSGTLMIVEKDTDLEVVKKSGHYSGQFFVLGGLVPILEDAPEKKVRITQLINRLIAGQKELREIIIALAANPDGDNTFDYLQKVISPHLLAGTKISILGRGLSTGTELEYSDAETLKNALKNRS